MLMPTARADDRGSALMLLPAAVLVLLVLGAIVVDSAVVFLAHRELNNRAAAAANDAVSLAVDETAYYRSGTVCLAPDVASAVVARRFAPGERPGSVRVVTADAETRGRRVRVTATAEVPLVFAPAIPGVARTARVSTTATATARGARPATDSVGCVS